MHFPKLKFFVFTLFVFCFKSSLLAQSNTCAGATLIVSDSTCKAGGSQLTGTLSGSTYTAGDIGTTTSACTFVASQDVWYKFVAKSQYPNIALSSLGSNFLNGFTTPANIIPKLQLFSGTCGSFTEIACANNSPITITPLGTALVIGDTYYIRVHKDNTTAPTGANWGFNICVTDQISKVSRMNEIFSRTYLSGAGTLSYPWEVTYGPDDSLWITEARGYKVYKMNTVNGGKREVLNISSTSTQFGTSGTSADTLYAQNMSNWGVPANTNGWPQGGFAGLALHPRFGDGSGRDYVYITYVHRYLGGTSPNGIFYRNKLVRFTYSSASGKLQSPVVMLNNLPGSQDHNSQRLIIAPVTKGGTSYLFLASGDMGAGQFGNRYRDNNSQNPNSYEGKILRLNLESDNPVTGETDSTQWIPNDNPYLAGKSAVWNIGIRNNQGFAYDTANNVLYGTSHGPYSDDEINIIEGFKNYGHPLVIGYVGDGNYNGNTKVGTDTSVTAGASFNDATAPSPSLPAFTAPYDGKSTMPIIGSESNQRNSINNANGGMNAQYKDPLFSAYAPDSATITATWRVPGANGNWRSEGWSGLDLYTNKLIPGWKKSLVAAGLKWGRLIKLNLNATGTATLPSNAIGSSANETDTITYFQSSNRYRDLAFSPNGKDIFVVMDNSSATSGPGVGNPTSAGCPGCVIKYSFLGYADAGGFSSIPKSIAVTTGTLNACNAGTTVTIDATNNNLWVPITGPDGNIMAEINAMGQNLGVITSSFYTNSNAIRVNGTVKYLDRNITITPTVQPTAGNPVKVRLYISKVELNTLIAAPASGVATINDLKIIKNGDACSAAINSTASMLTITNPGADLLHGANGYVLQTNVASFSTFYFAKGSIVLPVDLITFSGSLQSNLSTILKWKTENEINTVGFELERSVDGNNFKQIAFVRATGNNNTIQDYAHTDNEAIELQSTILYYRLKINNTNGSFKYSDIITILLPPTKASISVVPNPVVNDVSGNIVSPITGNFMLRIFDNTGRLISQTKIFVKKGNNLFSQNINQLAKGAYYIDISGNGINSRTKFQKL
jgi:trimeric autotransporter adhesin